MSKYKQIFAQYSQEAVDYQYETAFFYRLTKAIGKVRELNSLTLIRITLSLPCGRIGRLRKMA